MGQYLQPTGFHLPVDRWVHPDEFTERKRTGEEMGIAHVEAGPLVRSSYRADEQRHALAQAGVQRDDLVGERPALLASVVSDRVLGRGQVAARPVVLDELADYAAAQQEWVRAEA